jgi:hypothetical protein
VCFFHSPTTKFHVTSISVPPTAGILQCNISDIRWHVHSLNLLKKLWCFNICNSRKHLNWHANRNKFRILTLLFLKISIPNPIRWQWTTLWNALWYSSFRESSITRFEVVIAVILEVKDFTNVAPCRLVNICRRLEGTFALKCRQLFTSLYGLTSLKTWFFTTTLRSVCNTKGGVVVHYICSTVSKQSKVKT